MSRSARRQHWDAVYRSRDERELSWYQDDPGRSLKLIEHSGIAHDAALIDVGAGVSMLVDCLLEQGYRDVTVLDISETALEKSRKRLGRQAERVNWLISDVLSFTPERRYALWHDRALLHFMTLESDRRKYLDVLRHSLEPGGQVIVSTFAIGGPVRCSGLDTLQYDGERLLKDFRPAFRLLDEFREMHRTPAGIAQMFHYFHLVYEPDSR